MSLVYPIKLNDDYTCQGIDASGNGVVFNDLLDEGEKVGPWGEEDGEALFVDGEVVRKDDGLWVIALPPTEGPR